MLLLKWKCQLGFSAGNLKTIRNHPLRTQKTHLQFHQGQATNLSNMFLLAPIMFIINKKYTKRNTQWWHWRYWAPWLQVSPDSRWFPQPMNPTAVSERGTWRETPRLVSRGGSWDWTPSSAPLTCWAANVSHPAVGRHHADALSVVSVCWSWLTKWTSALRLAEASGPDRP